METIMARKNRDRDPEVYHHVFASTANSLLTLIDYEKVAPIIAGIIARYQTIFGIEIFAYTFLGNHFHLLVNTEYENLDEFMENVMREISKRVNKLYDVKGGFWSSRYKDEVIEDDNGALNCMLYIITNPVKHELTDSSSEWKGLNSLNQILSGEKCKTYFSLRGNRKIATVLEYDLKISYLPQFEKFTVEERAKTLNEMITEREKELKKSWIHPEASPKISNKQFGDSVGIKKKRDVQYFSKSKHAIERRQQLKDRENSYSTASRKCRMGSKSIKFPLFTYLPPLHRRPRIKSFVWAI